MVTPSEENGPAAAPPGSEEPQRHIAEVSASAPAPSAGRSGQPGQRASLPVVDIAATTCPFLVTERGAWRSIKPSPDHRCAAETPAGQPTREHQREFCLADRFAACPVYRALDEVTGRGRGPLSDDAGRAAAGARWALRPTAPVVVVGPPSSLDPRVIVRSRRLAAIALVVLMVAAFALVAFARLPGLMPGGSTASATDAVATLPAEAASGQPGAQTTPSPATPRVSGDSGAASSASPVPLPTGSVEAATATPDAAASSATMTPAPEPTEAASPSPSVPEPQTYVVQRGDTLSSIARRFDTTIEAIATANGITNPSLIGVGQVLVIP